MTSIRLVQDSRLSGWVRDSLGLRYRSKIRFAEQEHVADIPNSVATPQEIIGVFRGAISGPEKCFGTFSPPLPPCRCGPIKRESRSVPPSM